jgi:hypothetical protein
MWEQKRRESRMAEKMMREKKMTEEQEVQMAKKKMALAKSEFFRKVARAWRVKKENKMLESKMAEKRRKRRRSRVNRSSNIGENDVLRMGTCGGHIADERETLWFRAHRSGARLNPIAVLGAAYHMCYSSAQDAGSR